MLCFAGNQILIAQNHEGLSYMVIKLMEEYKRKGRKVMMNSILWDQKLANEKGTTNL